MFYNICYITSNWRLYKQRGFCYVARIMLYNKKICYIAHPNHKKAEARSKVYEGFSLPSRLYLVLLTDNCQPIRPAGSDPAGTLTPTFQMSRIIILTYLGIYKSGNLIPSYPGMWKSRHLIQTYPGLSQSTKPILGYPGLSWLAQGVVFQMSGLPQCEATSTPSRLLRRPNRGPIRSRSAFWTAHARWWPCDGPVPLTGIVRHGVIYSVTGLACIQTGCRVHPNQRSPWPKRNYVTCKGPALCSMCCPKRQWPAPGASV